MTTSSGSHSSVDGVLILETVRKLLAADLSADNGDENSTTCEYIDGIIAAIKSDAGLTDSDLDTARAWGGREWTGALARGLYGIDRIEELRAKDVL